MSLLAYSVDTITGGDKSSISVASFPWVRALSAGSETTCVIKLDDAGYTKADLQYLTAQWKRTIVLERDGVVLYAGMVRRRAQAGRWLILGLTDLWGLFARRGAWDHGAPLISEWSVTYTSASLALLAKRAVERGIDTVTFAGNAVPITLPADVSGAIERTYYGYHLEMVGDVLLDLMDEGIDIDFHPRWVGGALDWEMRVNPSPTLREWRVDAPKGGVTGFSEDSDGARMMNHSLQIGEGSGVDTLASAQSDLASELPGMSRVDSRKHVTNPDQLSALAGEALVKFKEPTESWSFEMLASGNAEVGDPPVGDLRLGDTARLWFDGDPWVEDGSHDRRIVKMAGDLGEKVTVTCQPTGGA